MLVELCPETRTWPPSRWDGHILLHTQHMQSSTRTAHMPICGDGMVTIPVTAWTSFLTYEQHYLLEVRIIDDLAFSHARVFTTNQKVDSSFNLLQLIFHCCAEELVCARFDNFLVRWQALRGEVGPAFCWSGRAMYAGDCVTLSLNRKPVALRRIVVVTGEKVSC